MTTGITVERQVHFERGRRSRKELRAGERPPPAPLQGRVPRVSRLLALAIHFERLVHEGIVKDYAQLARLGHITPARLTQITNLLCLAPDIQEEILFLPPTLSGRDALTERHLRPIAALLDWRKQRRMWRQLRAL